MTHNIFRPPLLYHGEGTTPLTGCEDVAMIQSEGLVDTTRPLRLSFLFQTTTSPAADRIVQGEGISDDEGTGPMVLTRGSRLRKQLDVRMWEVIQKEIMDCHEPSQSHRLRGCSNHLLSLERPLQIATLNGINSPERFQAFTTMIAVQLLATCFTLTPEFERYSRHSASYHDRSCPIGRLSDPRLISSLRLHTQFRNSPALGHNARNSSPALAWPDLRSEPSREERLAEKISRERRLQQLGKGPNSCRARSKDPSDEMERNSESMGTSISLRRRNQSRTEMTTSPRAPSQRRKFDRIYGRPRRFDSAPTGALPHTSVTQGARPIWRNSRRDAVGSHRWSFQPVLRSEDHPVYIQPVKEHIIKRWRALRPSCGSVTSTTRSAKSLTRPHRKRNKTSDIPSSDSSLITSGPSSESATSNAAPVRSSTPSPEAVELDLSAGAESHVRPTPFLSASGPSTAHSSGLVTSPHSSPLPANDLNGALVDDDASSYFPRSGTTFRTRSSTEQMSRGTAQRSFSTGTTLSSAPIIARTAPESKTLPSEGTGSSSSA